MKYPHHLTIAAPLALLLALSACTKKEPVDTAKIGERVTADAKAVVAAFNARDAARAAAYDAPDYVGMFHGADNVVGPVADEATMAQQVQDPAANWMVRDGIVTVTASGDMAVYQARYVFRFTDPITEQPTSETGNWVTIWRKQPDGSMKLWRSIAADTPPSAAAAATAG